MKVKSILAAIAIAVSFASCTQQAPQGILINEVTPQVNFAEFQARTVTESAQRTYNLAKVVDSKFVNDKDAKATLNSAAMTVTESKKTQAELRSLAIYSKQADDQAKRLVSENARQAVVIRDKTAEITSLKEKIKSLTGKLIRGKFIIAGLGVSILVLGALFLRRLF